MGVLGGADGRDAFAAHCLFAPRPFTWGVMRCLGCGLLGRLCSGVPRGGGVSKLESVRIGGASGEKSRLGVKSVMSFEFGSPVLPTVKNMTVLTWGVTRHGKRLGSQTQNISAKQRPRCETRRFFKDGNISGPRTEAGRFVQRRDRPARARPAPLSPVPPHSSAPHGPAPLSPAPPGARAAPDPLAQRRRHRSPATRARRCANSVQTPATC